MNFTIYSPTLQYGITYQAIFFYKVMLKIKQKQNNVAGEKNHIGSQQ